MTGTDSAVEALFLRSPAATGEPSGTRLPDHPDRAAAQAEIHARPIAPLSAPTRMRRVAMLLGQEPGAVGRARTAVTVFCAEQAIAITSAGDRRLDFSAAGHAVTWEFHTEFATVTWESRFNDRDPWPRGIGLEALPAAPVAGAVRVDVVAAPVIAEPALAGFDERSLCYARVEGNRAEVATDFLVDSYGYARYEIATDALGPYLLGGLVRRLIEIETYRVLALIGIGLARVESPALGGLEARLAAAMQDVVTLADPGRSATLLDAIQGIQLEAAASAERTRYRFAASQAYGDILLQRLGDLHERANGDHRMLESYLRQRIDPALATFRAIERRQTALLDQAARGTALLGTRISLDIDGQNRSILETISTTANSQFKLQRTVEGLSTIAIAYYLLGIISYAGSGLPHPYADWKPVALAALAPLLLVAVWFYLKWVQKR